MKAHNRGIPPTINFYKHWFPRLNSVQIINTYKGEVSIRDVAASSTQSILLGFCSLVYPSIASPPHPPGLGSRPLAGVHQYIMLVQIERRPAGLMTPPASIVLDVSWKWKFHATFSSRPIKPWKITSVFYWGKPFVN